jgi:hypothetical protein
MEEDNMKSYTDLKQAKKLAEFLPVESADMCFCPINYGNPNVLCETAETHEPWTYDHPCWSLAALRRILPWIININNDSYVFTSHNTIDKTWVYMYINQKDQTAIYQSELNEVDACYEVILKLKELEII